MLLEFSCISKGLLQFFYFLPRQYFLLILDCFVFQISSTMYTPVTLDKCKEIESMRKELSHLIYAEDVNSTIKSRSNNENFTQIYTPTTPSSTSAQTDD